MNRTIIVLMTLIIFGLKTHSFSATATPVATSVREIPSDGAFILIAPETDDTTERFLLVNPDTSALTIHAGEYDFARERESFRQFKDMYPVYWSLFNGMLFMHLLWH